MAMHDFVPVAGNFVTGDTDSDTDSDSDADSDSDTDSDTDDAGFGSDYDDTGSSRSPTAATDYPTISPMTISPTAAPSMESFRFTNYPSASLSLRPITPPRGPPPPSPPPLAPSHTSPDSPLSILNGLS
ncbi:hypothetical protein CYMTET_36507 [Cymbomonas tetramitiformis]|uniref:Uncharacterized protein n=1 Tax=Cymbomonas tetramitiformis TaxID=36881 RepID=A0AAE0F7C9_9CHLO|nr:hypothetical protein CYMTET_36507 [Cymbomonas tetramitiformis]